MSLWTDVYHNTQHSVGARLVNLVKQTAWAWFVTSWDQLNITISHHSRYPVSDAVGR